MCMNYFWTDLFFLILNLGLYSESTDSWAVAISQELPLLAVSTIIGSIKVWDLNTFKLVGTYSTNKKGFGTSVDIVRIKFYFYFFSVILSKVVFL